MKALKGAFVFTNKKDYFKMKNEYLKNLEDYNKNSFNFFWKFFFGYNFFRFTPAIGILVINMYDKQLKSLESFFDMWLNAAFIFVIGISMLRFLYLCLTITKDNYLKDKNIKKNIIINMENNIKRGFSVQKSRYFYENMILALLFGVIMVAHGNEFGYFVIGVLVLIIPKEYSAEKFYQEALEKVFEKKIPIIKQN